MQLMVSTTVDNEEELQPVEIRKVINDFKWENEPFGLFIYINGMDVIVVSESVE